MIQQFKAGQTPTQMLSIAVRLLIDAGVENPAVDARWLLKHAIPSTSSAGLAGMSMDPVNAATARKFGEMVAAREQRKPVSQILGKRHFATRQFKVTSDVLDPRPETEILIEIAKREPYTHVLDLGVGSGAILLTLLADRRGQSTGVGVDISAEVCQVAFDNSIATAVVDAAEIFISNWFEHVEGRFDLIVSNPPYITLHEMDDLAPEVLEWEPHSALTDGADGLTAYRSIAADVMEYLEPKGRLICEIGPTQGKAVSALFEAAGLKDIVVHPDLDGRDRVVACRAP